MLLIVSVAEPVLVSVTVCAALVVLINWLPKVRLVGDRLTAGAVVPVPVNETVCGLPAALSVTESVPVREPAAVGVKLTEIVHVADAATDVPQLFVWPKSPLAAMLMMVSVAEPV